MWKLDVLISKCKQSSWIKERNRFHPCRNKFDKKVSIILDYCNCNIAGSQKTSCDEDGKCDECKADIVGDKCDECSDGLTGFPKCQSKVFLLL